MSLSIAIREIDRVVVLELAGRLSVLEPSLLQLAWEPLERGERNLVISLADVSYLDSAGLGQLCWICAMVRNRGGDVALLKPTSRIKKLLSITKLDTVFQSFEGESDAIAAMQAFKLAVSA